MKIDEIITEAYKIADVRPMIPTINDLRYMINIGDFKPTLEGQINQYFVYFAKDRDSWYYFLIDKKLTKANIATLKSANIVGFLELQSAKNILGKHVELSYLRPEIQGRGIGRKLYDHVIRSGIKLVSGQAQTESSRNLWLYFINHPEKYRVYLQDVKNPSKSKQIEYDRNNNELSAEQEKELYGYYQDSPQDWRMVCTRK